MTYLCFEKGRQRFDRLKNAVQEQWDFSLGEPLQTEAYLVSHPQKISDFCVANDGAFLIGEAAGFISPSSLEGISYAHKNPCRAYRTKIIPTCVKLLLKTLKAKFMYRPFLRKLTMKSGLLSIEVVK